MVLTYAGSPSSSLRAAKHAARPRRASARAPAVPRELAELELAEQAGGHRDHDAARRRRWHRRERVAAVRDLERLAPHRLVAREVLGGDDAAARLHLGDDRAAVSPL